MQVMFIITLHISSTAHVLYKRITAGPACPEMEFDIIPSALLMEARWHGDASS